MVVVIEEGDKLGGVLIHSVLRQRFVHALGAAVVLQTLNHSAFQHEIERRPAGSI